MKIAGRRQSKNLIDKRPLPDSFTGYKNSMAAGSKDLNRRSVERYTQNKNRAAVKKNIASIYVKKKK